MIWGYRNPLLLSLHFVINLTLCLKTTQIVTCLIESGGMWGKMGEIVGFYWVDLRIRDSRIENCIKKHPLMGVLKIGGNYTSTFPAIPQL